MAAPKGREFDPGVIASGNVEKLSSCCSFLIPTSEKELCVLPALTVDSKPEVMDRPILPSTIEMRFFQQLSPIVVV